MVYKVQYFVALNEQEKYSSKIRYNKLQMECPTKLYPLLCLLMYD